MRTVLRVRGDYMTISVEMDDSDESIDRFVRRGCSIPLIRTSCSLPRSLVVIVTAVTWISLSGPGRATAREVPVLVFIVGYSVLVFCDLSG